MKKLFFWFAVFAMSMLVMVQPARADGVVAVTVGMEFYAGQYTVYPWQNSTEACTGKFQSMYGGLLPDSVRYVDFPSGGGYGYIVCYVHSLAVYGSSTYEGNLGQLNYRPKPSCPANSTGTTTCTCNTGYVPTVDGLACEVPVPVVICPAANTLHSSGFFNIGTSPNGSALTSACQGGCAIKTVGSTSSPGQSLYISASPKFRQLQNGVWYYFTEMSYFHTGQNCSPDTPNFLSDFVGNLPDMTCAAGQQMITMSGVTKCFNSDGTSTEPNSASAVAAAKTLADKQIANKIAAAASAVAAAGGSASDVAAAKVAAAGAAAGGSSGLASGFAPDDPMNAFCVDNPQASICKEQTAGATTVGTAALSGLYTDGALTGGKTVSSVIGSFKTRFMASGIGTGIAGFFTVNQAAGSCPIWSVNAPMIGVLSFDFYCGSTFQSLLPWIRSVLLLIFSVIAFRIAIL